MTIFNLFLKTTIEEKLTDQMLDQNYVVDDILTNADRFLENRIGKFKTWHIAFFVSAGILIASKYLLLN